MGIVIQICSDCKKKKAKWQGRCNDCDRLQRLERLQAAQAVVASRKCPACGEELKRNLSLTGWWQCCQFGAEGFRKDASKPACNFQTFTE